MSGIKFIIWFQTSGCNGLFYATTWFMPFIMLYVSPRASVKHLSSG